jgi:pyrimidine operon attenuation protein/uracil phosphoribosyltransferase
MQEVKDLILNETQIRQKVKRMAFEIFENNITEKELVIAGIPTEGYKLAEMIVKELSKITPFKLTLTRILLDKKGKLNSKVEIDMDVNAAARKTVIIVDDVLHTGKTFILGMKPFLEIDAKKIQVAVLVNRSHTIFPVYANYTGYELSTTLNEHIHVNLDKKGFGVYLY